MKKNDIHHLGTELIIAYRAEVERSGTSSYQSTRLTEALVQGFTDGINRLYRAIEADPRGVEP